MENISVRYNNNKSANDLLLQKLQNEFEKMKKKANLEGYCKPVKVTVYKGEVRLMYSQIRLDPNRIKERINTLNPSYIIEIKKNSENKKEISIYV